MKMNPYTGEPMSNNDYAPVLLQPKAELVKTKGVKLFDNQEAEAPLLKTKKYIPELNTNIQAVESPAEIEQKTAGNMVMDNAGGIMSFAMKQYALSQETASSTKESQKQMAASTLEGMQMGLETTGDAYGAASGAISGAMLGYADMQDDKAIRAKAMDREHREFVQAKKEERKRSYLLSQGKASYGSNKKTENTYG